MEAYPIFHRKVGMEAYPIFHRKVGKEVKELFHLKVNNGLYATIYIGIVRMEIT
jgi:hypothetical protein